jgi:hypothetical protein
MAGGLAPAERGSGGGELPVKNIPKDPHILQKMENKAEGRGLVLHSASCTRLAR